jgi:GH15 family glucan-1,4-alpha-glucosidase
VDRWRALRAAVHAEVCAKGYDAERGAFVQYYGGRELDASLLTMPQVGFLPAEDPRVRGTVAAVERELLEDGFVRRYTEAEEVDGLPPGEGTFLLCTFWLADAYVLQGRLEEARRIFERLIALRNDVGLLSEQYDPAARRLLGNFPQAFSHVGLVNTARNLARPGGPAEDRPRD